MRVVVALDVPLLKVQGFVVAGLDFLLVAVQSSALQVPSDIALLEQPQLIHAFAR